MRRVTGTVVGVLVAVTIFLLAGELLARALNVIDRLNGFSRLLYVVGPDADLPYLLRPGLQTTLLGVPVRVNRAGLRGPEIAPLPAADVHRVLVVGDSVVFGWGVAEEDALPTALRRRLEGAAGGRYEVLNAGVPGIDTTAEVRLLETVGLPLRPETVVVGTCINDYTPPPVMTPIGVLAAAGTRVDFTARSELLTLLRWVWTYARGELWYQQMARVEELRRETAALGAGAAAAGALDRSVAATHLAYYHGPAPAVQGRIAPAFAELARLAAARPLRTLVVVFPEAYQVGTADPDLAPQRRLLQACRDARLACLDLQPAFAAAGGDLFQDAQHPNARGLAVAADAIAASLLHPPAE